MTADVELQPELVDEGLDFFNLAGDEGDKLYVSAIRQHIAAKDAEVEALRAEVERVTCELMDAITRADKLAEALALLPDEIAMVEHNPDDGPLMFCCGREVNDLGPRGLLITHDGGCWYARMRALRDHDQEGK